MSAPSPRWRSPGRRSGSAGPSPWPGTNSHRFRSPRRSGRALGIPLPYVQIPIDAIRALNEDFAYANEWLNELGYRADIPATREIHPGTMDFSTWLERTGASQIASFLATAARTAGQRG